MNDQRPQIIRGTIDGTAKYCRIPVRSKLYETMQEGGELSAEAILAMPHEKAVVVIDTIMADWFYWMRRAGEYFVQLAPQETARMTEEEELFEAVRTIKSYCKGFQCNDECKIFAYCGSDGHFGKSSPRFWPDPEEGGADNA